MTKSGDKTVKAATSRFEVALAHDAGTTKGGLYGLTDLFSYANEFAARRRGGNGPAPVRLSHWLSDDDERTIRCTYDSSPGAPHEPNVIILPNNHRAIVEPKHESRSSNGCASGMQMAR